MSLAEALEGSTDSMSWMMDDGEDGGLMDDGRWIWLKNERLEDGIGNREYGNMGG